MAAAAITAPPGSDTVPVMVPRSLWAKATAAHTNIPANLNLTKPPLIARCIISAVRMQLIRSILILAGIAAIAQAQFPADSTLPREKRTKRQIGKFAPGPTPRTKDGKPDLNGVWGYAGYTSDIAKD